MNARRVDASIAVGSIRLRLARRPGEVLALAVRRGGGRKGAASVEVRVKGGPWRRPRAEARLVSSTPERIVLSWEVGPLQIVDEYGLEAGSVARRLRVTNRSRHEIQLIGVRMLLPGLTLGAAAECRVEAPATSLRPRLAFEQMARRAPDDPWEAALAPSAKERWGRALEDAPDVTPGLLAIHNERRSLTFLTWYHSETEAGTPLAFGDGERLTFGHEVGLAGWLLPGGGLDAATQYLSLVRGAWAKALAAFRAHYALVGIVPPMFGKPTAWVPRSSIYEVHPGQFGGFRGLAAALPRLRELGITTLYLLPVMRYDNRAQSVWDEDWLGSGSPYAIKDFEAFEPTLGTSRDFRRLVERAHRLGLRVLLDFVPQGCATDARYVREHPEWFCRDESGRLVSSHGWVDTYSFDWANPDFQEYMLGWALRLVDEFGFDGYRVDAPHAKEPNWDRAIPYHASTTSLGVLSLLERLQLGLKRGAADRVLLCEVFGPIFARSHDFQYDYLPCVNLYALLRGELTVAEIGTWFQDYWAAMPPGAVRVSFTETHDTRTQMRAYAWRGSAAEQALFAILIMAGFVPMLWSGQEAGREAFYQRILRARAASAALLSGERAFNVVGCSHPDAFSVVCRAPNETVWGVVSLHAERTPLRFSLPPEAVRAGAAGFRLFDLIERTLWTEHGRPIWVPRAAPDLTISLVPFLPYFFRIEGSPA